MGKEENRPELFDGALSVKGKVDNCWGFAMGGIDWMDRAELAEAIPPVYTEFFGKQLKRNVCK